MAQFILSPVLAILITNYSVPGTFIIIGGLMLNIVASSAMYRPTEIQSEIDEQVRPKNLTKLFQLIIMNIKTFINYSERERISRGGIR